MPAKTGFAAVKWGPDDAKGDRHLPDYFVEIPEFSQIVAGTARYLIGRKGTGKTAILERIRLDAAADPLKFARSLSLRSLPLGDLRDLRDRSYRDKSQYVPIWMLLIGIELAGSVLEDQGAGPPEAVADLRQFLQNNFDPAEPGFAQVVTRLKARESKLLVDLKWLGAQKGHSAAREATESIHFTKAARLLLDRIAQVRSESTHYLFLDELDEGFRAGDTGIRLLLLALLRAVEDCYLELSETGVDFRPLLALRADIFDGLEDNDLNKLDDHTVRLRWSSHSHGGHSLKDVVGARIRASIEAAPSQDAWAMIAHDTDRRLPRHVRTLWSYICSRTFERPRDVVKFLKTCQKYHHGGLLKFWEVQRAESEYSDWLYRELRDEIHSHLPVWKESLQCLTRLGQGVLTREELTDALTKDPRIRSWIDNEGGTPDAIIAALFEFSVLGNLDSHGRWLFRYKDHDLVDSFGMKLIVHFGFTQKLKILKGGERFS